MIWKHRVLLLAFLFPPLVPALAGEGDLVTLFFGGNDWDSGMRGAEGGPPTAVAGKRVLRQGGRRQCDAPGPRFWAWAAITSTT